MDRDYCNKLIFWQNIISPHQIDFLEEIDKYIPTILVVEEMMDDRRMKEKWVIPNFNKLEIMVKPSTKKIDSLINDINTVHVFSGIGAYKFVHKAFLKAIKKNRKIGILSESYEISGFKGFLKIIRGNLQRLMYGRQINFICVTGNDASKCFLKFGYSEEKIFQWGYFVNSIKVERIIRKRSLVYVGSLIPTKNILDFVKSYIDNDGFGYDSFDIIGDGFQRNELEKLIKTKGKKLNINILGRLKKEEVFLRIKSSSALVIPSRYDGWAVVVNEALLCGTPVIASSKVGARILLDGIYRGGVFDYESNENLKKVFIKWRNNKSINHNYIQEWAERYISPETAASYFKDILDFTYSKTKSKPIAPWLENTINIKM
ncbi:glycosyltransferase [Flagellimonas marinaquae]